MGIKFKQCILDHRKMKTKDRYTLYIIKLNFHNLLFSEVNPEKIQKT